MTEYHYHDREQPILETDYFSLDSIEAQFTEMLMNYRSHHFLSVKPNRTNAELSELKDLEDRAKIAQDTFRAAFRAMNTFEEQQLLVEQEEIAKETLLRAIRTQHKTLLEEQVSTEETFADLVQCSTRLMQLTSDSSQPNILTRWPFIQKIR